MTGIGEALLISAAVSLATAGLTYALTPTQKVESGRINDLTVAKSSYGASLPYCWGKVRVGGNLIWATYLEESRKKSRQSKGAKVETTEFTYYGSFAVMFADCPFRPLVDIPRVWMNKKLTFSKVGGGGDDRRGREVCRTVFALLFGAGSAKYRPAVAVYRPDSKLFLRSAWQ